MAKIMIGKYEGSIYPEGNGYTGALELGFDPNGKRKRLKRKGRTKTEVRDKLKEAAKDLESGIKSSATYTSRTPSRTGSPKDSRDATPTPSRRIAASPTST